MFSGPTGNLFCIFTNVVFTSSFEHILSYNICTFSHCVYKKSAKIISFKPKITNKNPKTNPHPRKGQTGIWFFGLHPPPPPPPPPPPQQAYSAFFNAWECFGLFKTSQIPIPGIITSIVCSCNRDIVLRNVTQQSAPFVEH